VLGAGFAQAGPQIDDAGYQDQSGCVHASLGLETAGGFTDALHAAVGDAYIGDRIHAVGGVDDAGAADTQAHQPPSRSAAAWLPMAMDITAMRMAIP
jgi:hypothetical protein